MNNQEQLQKEETEKILAFRKEFEDLMDKHGITGVLLGLRPVIREIDDLPGKKAMPAFLDMYLKDVTTEKLESLLRLHDKLGGELKEALVKKLFSSLMNDDEPCECENCKGQAKADPAEAEKKSE